MPKHAYRLRIPEAISALVTRRLRPVASLQGIPLDEIKRDLQETLIGYINLGQVPPGTTEVGHDPEYGPVYAFAFGGIQVGFCIWPATLEVFIVGVDDE
ncbi:hypothetical protein [Ensifer adhaerens]|jgi:hypothetical protein|uniref:hypothetical protein n=1 Tax=Ensifer adhaerens TaxID=106592 RepID=UPI002030C508|nr:hypothetical protein [Ensifer adhaerens]